MRQRFVMASSIFQATAYGFATDERCASMEVIAYERDVTEAHGGLLTPKLSLSPERLRGGNAGGALFPTRAALTET